MSTHDYVYVPVVAQFFDFKIFQYFARSTEMVRIIAQWEIGVKISNVTVENYKNFLNTRFLNFFKKHLVFPYAFVLS